MASYLREKGGDGDGGGDGKRLVLAAGGELYFQVALPFEAGPGKRVRCKGSNVRSRM